MPRMVLVDTSNIVEQIIMAASDYVPPTGLTAIISDTASIGDTYNPSNGTFTKPSSAPTKQQLIEYANQIAQNIAKRGVTINVNPPNQAPMMVPADTDASGRADLAGAAFQAQSDPGYGTTWSTSTGSFSLNAAQVLALWHGVSVWIDSIWAVNGQIVARINAGMISTEYDVLHPPSPIPPWPTNS